ncbi:MAG: ABC transporter permease subunit [Pirellulales bacterium]
MNTGLLLKATREVWPVTVVCGGVLAVVEGLLAYVMPTFAEQMSINLTQIEFIRHLVQAMLGAELAGRLGPEMALSIPWTHPVVLAVAWAHAVICSTRVPAAEIDGGTADILLTLPVSRWQIMISETIVSMTAGLVILGMLVLGNLMGNSLIADGPDVDTWRRTAVAANLYCLYLSVGGIAWLACSLSSRRAHAITAVFLILVASFLLNYLAPFWEAAKTVSGLSLLVYHRPLPVLRDGVCPWHDMAILLALASSLWLAAGTIFARRNICTV